MKLHLDSTLCQGYGLCHEQAPDLIDLDEWGYAAVRVPEGPEDQIIAAVQACPMKALQA